MDNRPRMDKPTQTLKSRLAQVAPYFADSKRGFVLVVIGAVLGAATEPAVPALLKPLLDSGFKAGALPLWSVPLAIIGLFAIRGVAGFMAQYGLSWAANRATLTLRTEMFDSLTTAEPTLFSGHTASSLTNMLSYEVGTGSNLLVSSLLALIKDSMTLIALLGYLLWINPLLTLFVTVLFPTVAIVMRTLSKRLRRLTVETQKATDELAYVVEENVLAWRMVRLHGAGAAQARRFGRVAERLRSLSIKSVVAASTMTPVTQMLAACALSAVIVAALWQSGQQGSSVGSFVAFVTAMLMVVTPLKHLSEVAGPITRGLTALERGASLVNQAPREKSGGYAPDRAQGHLVLEDVTLRYAGEGHAPALDGVSLELKVGESVALVGPSGAGKSTLVNLLPLFIKPTAGRIVLDGHPLGDWDVAALRRQFALVSQDVILFNDSIAANVALGDGLDGEPDRARVTEALRAANLLDFVNSQPNGIDALVGHNGGQLSGGQRQRLAIARAIYKDAPILILDEATSALDSESERLVQQALERLMKGRTSLVIAHRLSTIERVDRIIALDGGRVAEQGTHQELIDRGGLYARLHSLQFKGAGHAPSKTDIAA